MSPGLTLPLLKERCDSVFKSTKQADPIRRIYVNGVLWNLCTEYGGLESDAVFAARCQTLAKSFVAETESAVADIKLMTPATAEAAFALALAVGLTTGIAHNSLISDVD